MYIERSKKDPVRILKDAYVYLRRTHGEQAAIDLIADKYYELLRDRFTSGV